MKKTEIIEKIAELVSEIINVPVTQLNPNASFMDDYNMDSLRALEILAAIENQYEIMIPPENLSQMRTFQNVADITIETMKASGMDIEE